MAQFCYEKNQFNQWKPCKWEHKPTDLPREKKGDRTTPIQLSDDENQLTIDELAKKYPAPKATETPSPTPAAAGIPRSEA